MKLGTVFPQTEIGTDPVAIRDYAQTVEGAGYDYLLAYEHVTGAHPDRFNPPPFPFRPRNSGRTYTYESEWHEPLMLYSHLAAVTTRLEFVTSVLLLAQRQTVLVAKQVAELDLLSGGRFRLAVGIGWNFTEYEALNEDWSTRTERIEEQIAVLRMLWSEPLVSFNGRFHTLDRVGINPRPARPLPIWYASSARPVVLRRTARLADGWMPLLIPPEGPRMAVERLHQYLQEAGKDPKSFGIDARAGIRPGAPPAGAAGTEWVEAAKLWKSLGATHFCIRAGDGPPREILANALRAKKIFDEEVGP